MSNEGFQAILMNLVGDGMLQMAAFLTYSGSKHSMTDAFAPAMAIRTHFICLIFHDDGEYGVCICCFYVLTTYQNLHSFAMTWLSLNTPSFTGSMSIIGPSLWFTKFGDWGGGGNFGSLRSFLDCRPEWTKPSLSKDNFPWQGILKTLGGDVRFGSHFLLRMRRNSN